MNRSLYILVFCIVTNFVFSQEQFALFFNSNKFELEIKENNRLQNWISENRKAKILSIHGFTDEDGSNGYNDTLAQNRVDHIYKLLNNQIKIRDDFKTITFGERFVQSKNKSENRKVIIYYILEKDFFRENEILNIKEKSIILETKEDIVYPEVLVYENPNGTKSEFKLDVDFMKKIADAPLGEKLKIDNLNFVINTFAVVPESRSKMFELLLVLQKNPKLKIEIHGHLCCVSQDRKDLSTQRAKAIKNFLVYHNISPDRLSFKGFGSTAPLYLLPEKDELERAANRRVEILIVEK